MTEFPHLPAGRDPGAQSLRNRQRRTIWAPVVGVVGTAMFAAGVWAAAGGRGEAFDRQEELFGGLLFAAFGLVSVYAASTMWDTGPRRRDRALRGVTLAAPAEVLRRGEAVAVSLTVGSVEGLEIGLACDERVDVETRAYVKGSTTVIRQTAEHTVHEEWQPAPPGVGEHELTFRVPAAAPYSYEGDCVSYAWRVSARIPKRGRPDARLDEPVWVHP